MSSTAVSKSELVTNAAGRAVPLVVNGKQQIAYCGVDADVPLGHKAAPPVTSNRDYPADGDKRVPDLATALKLCGLRDGMTISSHHHLRDGDKVAVQAQWASRI
jgi:citrate lyase subunit alpha / citrate CoA-transferase